MNLFGEPRLTVDAVWSDDLTADHTSDSINWIGFQAVEPAIYFGPKIKETFAEMHAVKAFKIKIGATQDVEYSSFRQQEIHEIHVMKLFIRNIQDSRDVTVQIDKSIYLDGTLCLAELRP